MVGSIGHVRCGDILNGVGGGGGGGGNRCAGEIVAGAHRYIYLRPTDENVFSADRKPNERNCHVPRGAMRHCHVSEKYDATANSENDARRTTPARWSTSADVRQRGFFTTTRSVSVPYTGAYIRFETRSSAIAEGPRDASCQLNSCQLPRNSTETTCTTSPEENRSYEAGEI